jgi:hypothetical protein
MATNTEKPVGPGIFSRNQYSVTIAEDGKILVKKDDWLSKYSWALYSDYETLDVFVRGNPDLTSATEEIKGIKAIDDVDLIKTGEYLIHEPTYFSWMEKRGQPIPQKPIKPVKPENVRSTNWMAANLGGLDGVVFPGAAGAILLVFRNIDTGTNYYYVLLHLGFGVGINLANIVKALKNWIQALGAAFLAKKAATAKFKPVFTRIALSARDFERLDITYESWKAGTGSAKQNYSYEKITGYRRHFIDFHVTFVEKDWALPALGGSFTSGALIWVW